MNQHEEAGRHSDEQPAPEAAPRVPPGGVTAAAAGGGPVGVPVGGDRPEGPISAAIVAAGVGAAALGLFTTLAEASAGMADRLRWDEGVGPLSGKTCMAVIVWLVSWAVLQLALRNKGRETGRALTVALVLIGLGVLGTFPTFFQLFAPE